MSGREEKIIFRETLSTHTHADIPNHNRDHIGPNIRGSGAMCVTCSWKTNNKTKNISQYKNSPQLKKKIS